ncbi:hypothetical protein ACFQU2_19040 [Siccirubricoccus deserti]
MDSKARRKLLTQYRVETGKGFQLKDHDPADTAGFKVDKPTAAALLQEGVERLAALQDMLYAQDRWAVLCIFQAMDAAGKDGAIKHVFSGVNPQGCHVESFKAPGPVEKDHDFLWRHLRALPARGMIGIHNRSWYEEVLVARVHPEILEGQRLPRRCAPSGSGMSAWRISPRSRPISAGRGEGREILPARQQGGAARALPEAHRGAGEALEIQRRRRG